MPNVTATVMEVAAGEEFRRRNGQDICRAVAHLENLALRKTALVSFLVEEE
jgi:hypothetical protein